MSGTTIASLLYLLSAAIGLSAAHVAWRRRRSRGAVPLAGMLGAAAIWALAAAVEVHLATVSARRLASQVQYLGVVAVAPFFFEMAIDLARLHGWQRPRARLAVWGIPALSLAVAWTSQWHRWLWADVRLPGPGALFTIYDHGPWFWVLTAHSYLLMAGGTAVLLAAVRRLARAYRPAVLAALAAVNLAWLGNALYVFRLSPLPGFDWLALSVSVTGTVLAWMVVSEGLLDAVPRTPEALLAAMSDAVVLLDGDDRIAYSNPPAVNLFGLTAATGRLPESIRLPDWQTTAVPGAMELPLEEVPGGPRWLELRVNPVVDRWGDRAGRLVVARDVTRRKALDAEREQLLEDLRRARDARQPFDGLLRLCAHCHRLQDDRGWDEVESVLRRHAAEVSHGICPDCHRRHYGGGTPDSVR